MNKCLVDQACEGLELRDIFQREATARLSDSYDPKFEADTALEIQIKHLVVRTEVLVPQEGIDLPKLFRVYVDLGARWRHAPETSRGSPESTESDARPEDMVGMLGQIEAGYVAEYEIKHDVDQPALDEFALHNPSYHVWPFFREFVISQSARMNVPKLVLPMIQLAQNRALSVSNV